MSKKREESDLSSDSEEEVEKKEKKAEVEKVPSKAEVEKVLSKADEGTRKADEGASKRKPAHKKRKVSSETSDSEEEKPKSAGLEEGAFWVNEKRLRRVQVGLICNPIHSNSLSGLHRSTLVTLHLS